MRLEELFGILNSITGFKGKVAYRFFPVGKVPPLPFICYFETSTDNTFADNKVYNTFKGVSVELYTESKDLKSEGLIEDALNQASIPWNKYEQYIDTEKCYQITYSMEV